CVRQPDGSYWYFDVW
nr:immunoglobulin heavy chain junction region [Mus musculus]